MEGKCRKCGRLIYDVTDMDMLPNVLECQHCHHRNIIKPPVAPESVPETEPGSELAPEELREESPGPVPEESAEEVD